MPDAADRADRDVGVVEVAKWVKVDKAEDLQVAKGRADRDAQDVDRWVKVDRVGALQVARDKDVGAVRWVREDNEVAMGKADRDVDRWDKADKAEVLQAGKAAVIPQTA